MMIKNHIRNTGHEVVCEADLWLKAIAQFKSLKPDLVTMDIAMPMLDGIQAVEEIIKFNQRQKINVL